MEGENVMTDERIKVSEEMADAIEHLREYTITKALLRMVDGEINPSHPLSKLAMDSLTKDEIIRAVFYGYDVETPAARVKSYYEELRRREEYEAGYGGSGSQHRQGWQSVRETLNLLGIKIEGVND